MSLCDVLLRFYVSAKSVLEVVFEEIHKFGMSSSNYGSLFAALVVAFILFFIRELFIRSSNYSGVFYTMSTVEESTYRPYRSMRLFHTLVLYSDGYVVSGTSEKTGDIDAVRAYEFPGASKIRGEVNGRVERNYFWSTVMNLHIVEQGFERPSTSFMTIRVRRFKFRNRPDSGGLFSTAGRCKGKLLCGRKTFIEHPIGYVPFQSISVSDSSS